MKRVFSVAAACLPLMCFSSLVDAASLRIPANSSYTVPMTQTEMALDELVIGDGATISFAPGVVAWDLRAVKASIGEGVIVDAAGAAGIDGEDGAEGKSCSDNPDGQPGQPGSAGGNAVSLSLRLGITEIGSLAINASGGRGGSGGAGGAGANYSERCEGVSAGRGGNGGAGGRGGEGGSVRVFYHRSSPQLTANDVQQAINVDTSPGRSGAGGAPGAGGEGGEGRYITARSLTGNRKWVAGADEGETGKKGSDGLSGGAGRTVVAELETSSVTGGASTKAEVMAPAVAPSELEALRLELNALRRRVEALEARK